MRRLAALSLVSVACIIGEDPVEELNPERLTDQSGGVFAWDCTQYTGCELHRIDGSPPLPACASHERPGYGYSWSRLISLDGACRHRDGWSWSFVPGWSRLVVCETDADCPQLNFLLVPDEFECRAGFCQNKDIAAYPPGELPRRFDMIDLCLGDDARRAGGYDVADEFQAALDEACPPDDPEQKCSSLPPGCPDLRE